MNAVKPTYSYRNENLIGDVVEARYKLTAARRERSVVVGSLLNKSISLEDVVIDVWATRNTPDEQKSLLTLRLITLFRVANSLTNLQSELALLPFFMANGSRRNKQEWKTQDWSSKEFVNSFPFHKYTLRWLTASKERVHGFLSFIKNLDLEGTEEENSLILKNEWPVEVWVPDNELVKGGS